MHGFKPRPSPPSAVHLASPRISFAPLPHFFNPSYGLATKGSRYNTCAQCTKLKATQGSMYNACALCKKLKATTEDSMYKVCALYTKLKATEDSMYKVCALCTKLKATEGCDRLHM